MYIQSCSNRVIQCTVYVIGDILTLWWSDGDWLKMVRCAHLSIDCFIFGRDIFKVANLPPELTGLNHRIADKSL